MILRKTRDFGRNLLVFLPVGKDTKPKKLLPIIGLLLVMLAFSGGVIFLLTRLESFIKTPLEQYAYYAYGAVFLVSLLSSATVLIPAPGVAITLAAASKWNPMWVALAAACGGTLGELTSYMVGYFGSVALTRQKGPLYVRAEKWTRRYGLLVIFALALIPTAVFDVVGIVGGALRMPIWRYLIAVFAGRLPQSFFIVYVGPNALHFFFPFLFS